MNNFDEIWAETVGSLPEIKDTDATISNGLDISYAQKFVDAYELSDEELYEKSTSGEL